MRFLYSYSRPNARTKLGKSKTGTPRGVCQSENLLLVFYAGIYLIRAILML